VSKRHRGLVQGESKKQPSSVIAFVTVPCQMCLKRGCISRKRRLKVGVGKHAGRRNTIEIDTSSIYAAVVYLTPQRRETCRDSGESDELKILTLSTSSTTIWPRCFGSRKRMQYVEYVLRTLGMCRSGDSSMVGPDSPGN